MPNAEAERFKIEWFYGMELFLKSKAGEIFLNDLLGKESDRDEVEYKVFLMLLETAIKVGSDLVWDTEQSLTRWRSLHRENARNNYLAGKFARDDFWDQRKWDDRFEQLHLSAQSAALVINQIIEDAKAVLEDEISNERQTPIVPVDEIDRLRCAKPSDMVTLQCENDPEAMARVRRYLEEMGSDLVQSPISSNHVPNSDIKRTRTIFPPSTIPPGSFEAGVKIPQNKTPVIVPSESKRQDDSVIVVSFENDEDD